MFTAWGYEVEDSIPPLLTAEEFDSMTGGKWAGDLRATSALNAASQAIRNACGWHIAPSLQCSATLTADGKLVKLAANYVSSIESLTEDGIELTDGQDFEWRHDGLIRRACFRNFSRKWDGIAVEYTAGYDADVTPDLAEAVRSIAEGVLALPVGVMSESADGVSISYSSNAASVAAALTDRQRAALEPYRLVSTHAA